jgi:hypothetical protein
MRAENLCHRAIFVNQASGAVTPEDADVVQVGDAMPDANEREAADAGPQRADDAA